VLTVDFEKLDLKPGMRVLDAGCGGGRHVCEAFRNRGGVSVAGIDLSWKDLETTRDYLRLMASERNIRAAGSLQRAV